MSGLQPYALGALLACMLGGLAVGTATGASAQSDPPKPVLELFTSQGCSSCPPADALLGNYIARGDVIALSLPVDYWDRLGWKDTYAKSAHSDRQRDYARQRGDGAVYTPQIVVDGRLHAVGSSKSEIETAIAATRAQRASTRAPVSISIVGAELQIEVGAATAPLPATLWLALVQKNGSVSIGRGENAGRKITYHNVAREMMPLGRWTGSPMHVRVPDTEFAKPDIGLVTVLLQQDQGGPIIGAAELAIPPRQR